MDRHQLADNTDIHGLDGSLEQHFELTVSIFLSILFRYLHIGIVFAK